MQPVSRQVSLEISRELSRDGTTEYCTRSLLLLYEVSFTIARNRSLHAPRPGKIRQPHITRRNACTAYTMHPDARACLLAHMRTHAQHVHTHSMCTHSIQKHSKACCSRRQLLLQLLLAPSSDTSNVACSFI